MEKFILSDRNTNVVNLSEFYALFIKEYHEKLEKHFKSKDVYERLYDRFYTAKRLRGVRFKFKDIEILKIKDLYNQDTNCLNNNVKVELNGKIKLAESLIKQIFLPQINNQIPVIDENTIYNSL